MRATRRPQPRIRVAFLLTFLVGGLLVAAASPAQAADPLQPGTSAVVRADGDCLRVRDMPSLSGNVLACLPEGTVVDVLVGTTQADGIRWQQIRGSGVTGWAADMYLQAVATPPPAAPAPAAPVSAPNAAAPLPVPPVGGLTLGMAGTTDPAALAAAQSFPVETVSVFDLAAQRFFVYVPGAPPFASTLNAANLRTTSIATLKRQGTLVAGAAPPLATPLPATGVANALPAPPAGGLTQGIAGTNDPAALATGQPFPVESISMLDVASQAWLVFIPGAPAIVDTLNSGSLAVSAVVTIKSSGGSAPAPPPSSTPPSGYPAPPAVTPGGGVPGPAANEPVAAAALRTVRLTYYYCEQGSIRAGIGDGGGFCGYFANGQRVHAGGASCARSALGERFRIHGDPDELVYTCMDTGGGVGVDQRDIWFADSDTGYTWWRAIGPTAVIEQVTN